MLKQMVCLLSCQPRNMESQLPAALDCLLRSFEALAVGVYWPDESGTLQPRAVRPARFRLDEPTRQDLMRIVDPSMPAVGHTSVAWLAVPMKVGGLVLGRLWLVDRLGHEFSQDEREFLMMAGNQLSLAQENARLYDEVQRLAARRGELLRRIIAAQDERCRRISRELHDEISQSLAAMSLDLEAVQVADAYSRDGALQRLGDLRGRLLTALDEVNRIILDLRPTMLEDLGLMSALRWYASQRLEPLGVRVHVRSSGVEERLQPHVETTLYRIAQEALTNVAKHAQAEHVWLSVSKSRGYFILSVRDDGHGFSVGPVLADPDDRVGLGLFGMKERATLVGGTFTIESHPGKGARVSVRIPVELETDHDPDSGLAG
jgi:signal transduction histidine kinase